VTPAETFPIFLSLRVAALALLVVAPIGVALAWVQARKRYKVRGLVDAAVLLPLVLPPSVVGFFLVVLLGRRGIGRWLEDELGVRLVFSPAGAVVASFVVALPIVVKTAQPAIESVPAELEKVGRTLGLSQLALFFRVTLPSAWRGVTAALVLGFARALGEFGATLMLAGNIPGRTNTMPLETFAAYQAGDDRRAMIYVSILTALSVVVVLLAARLAPRDAAA
jgi:molybdate transport system permease protein